MFWWGVDSQIPNSARVKFPENTKGDRKLNYREVEQPLRTKPQTKPKPGPAGEGQGELDTQPGQTYAKLKPDIFNSNSNLIITTILVVHQSKLLDNLHKHSISLLCSRKTHFTYIL